MASAWLLVRVLGPVLGVSVGLDWTVAAGYGALAIGLVILLAGAAPWPCPP